MRELFFESSEMKIYREGDAFDIYTVSGRNWDGIYSVDLNFYMRVTNVYSRDWLGRTTTGYHYNRANDPNYSLNYVLREIWQAWKTQQITMGEFADWQAKHEIYFDEKGNVIL